MFVIGFTGSRDIEDQNNMELLNKGLTYNDKTYNLVYKEIDIAVKYILLENNLTFKDIKIDSGMARGFDEVRALYRMDRKIPLILSIPESVIHHKNKTSKKIKTQAIKYNQILKYVENNKESEIFEIKDEYNGDKYKYANFARNQNIVDNSNVIISYMKKHSNGTYDCIQRRKKKKIYLGDINDILIKAKEKYNLELNNVLNIKLGTDLLKEKTHVLIHGCNCYNTMGAGIAKVLREKYPSIYIKDKDFLKENNIPSILKEDLKNEDENVREERRKKILGKFSFYKLNNRKDDEPFYIFNLYSQLTYFDNERFSLKAFDNGLNDIIKFLLKERKNNGVIKISMSRIGMSLGRGKLNEIYDKMQEITLKYKNDNIQINWCFLDNNLENRIINYDFDYLKKNLKKNLNLNPSLD